MPPDRHLLDATPGAQPEHGDVQQLVEAERGLGTQGVLRRWLCSDSALTVLTSDSTGVKISRDNGTTAPTTVINVGTPAGGDLSGAYPNPSLSVATLDALIPPGVVWAWAGTGAPVGWLGCNGAVVPRASFPKLFTAIGTTYNTGGEAGTDFRLPNLTGRVVLGLAGTHPLGQAGGAETVLGPAHTHPGTHSHGMNGHTHGPGAHTHGPGAHTHGLGTHVHAQSSHTHGLNGHAHNLNNHSHDINHDHGNAAAAAAASGTALNGRFTAGGANALPDAHTHDVNLPPLGTVVSGGSTTDTGGPTAAVIDTAGPTAANTGAPSGTASTTSDGPSGAPTAGPSADATAAASGSTAPDGTAPTSDYGAATVATLPPFLTLSYIIKAS